MKTRKTVVALMTLIVSFVIMLIYRLILKSGQNYKNVPELENHVLRTGVVTVQNQPTPEREFILQFDNDFLHLPTVILEDVEASKDALPKSLAPSRAKVTII